MENWDKYQAALNALLRAAMEVGEAGVFDEEWLELTAALTCEAIKFHEAALALEGTNARQ